MEVVKGQSEQVKQQMCDMETQKMLGKESVRSSETEGGGLGLEEG